jgi:hypothetical protein
VFLLSCKHGEEAVRHRFFHIKHSDGMLMDEDGIDLPASKAALRDCGRLVREVLAEPEYESTLAGAELRIANGRGRVLLIIPLADRSAHRTSACPDAIGDAWE